MAKCAICEKSQNLEMFIIIWYNKIIIKLPKKNKINWRAISSITIHKSKRWGFYG